MTNQNKAYFYDPITREFVGITLLDRDPLGGGFLLPANAVTFAPVLAEAKTPVLSDDGQTWLQVDDYRGLDVYQITDGTAHRVNALGALPDGVTTIKPATAAGERIAEFDVKNQSWLYRPDYTGVTVYSIADGSARVLTEADAQIPGGYTTEPRPSEAHDWDAKKGDWVINKTKLAELDRQEAQAAFEQAKAAKMAEINNQAQAYIDHATGADQLPVFEVQSWAIQGAEAKTWKADPTAPTPTLDAIAKARGIEPDALRAGAYKKTMLYEGLVAAVTGQRQKYNDLLRAAKTADAVNAIIVVYGAA